MPPIMWWTFVLPVTWRFLLYERLNFIIFRSIFMKWQLFAWHLFAMLFQVFHSFLVKCCQQLSPFIDLHAHKEFLHFFRVLFFAYNKSGTSMQTVNSDEVLMSQIPFSFQGFYHNKKHVWQSKDELCICFNLNMLSYGRIMKYCPHAFIQRCQSLDVFIFDWKLLTPKNWIFTQIKILERSSKESQTFRSRAFE